MDDETLLLRSNAPGMLVCAHSLSSPFSEFALAIESFLSRETSSTSYPRNRMRRKVVVAVGLKSTS